jgi:hypothetical protein
MVFYVLRIVPKEVRMTCNYTFMCPLIFIILTRLDISLSIAQNKIIVFKLVHGAILIFLFKTKKQFLNIFYI